MNIIIYRKIVVYSLSIGPELYLCIYIMDTTGKIFFDNSFEYIFFSFYNEIKV